MTKEEWNKVSEYITMLHRREALMVEYINQQNYGLAKQVFFEKVESLKMVVED